MKRIFPVIVGFLFLLPTMLSAQSAQALIAAGDSLHEHQHPAQALAKFQAAEKLEPNNPDILWRISREYYDKGNIAPKDQQADDYLSAEKYARKAAKIAPDNAKAHLWIAISVGKVALLKGGKEKVELSREVKEQAMKSIELDPNDDSAYHVLARWHYEVATLSWFLKAAAKVVYGGLPPASLDSSIYYFKKAIAIAPKDINNHLQLAKSYIANGQKDLARAQLKKVEELPVSDVEDPAHKKEAKKLLEDL